MKEYAPFHYSFLEKAQRPVRIDEQQFWTEKAKSVPGFKLGLRGQNAIALQLAPLPLPHSEPPLETVVKNFDPQKPEDTKAAQPERRILRQIFFPDWKKWSFRSGRPGWLMITWQTRLELIVDKREGAFPGHQLFFLPNGCIRLMTKIATVRFLGTVRSCRELLETSGNCYEL